MRSRRTVERRVGSRASVAQCEGGGASPREMVGLGKVNGIKIPKIRKSDRDKKLKKVYKGKKNCECHERWLHV